MIRFILFIFVMCCIASLMVSGIIYMVIGLFNFVKKLFFLLNIHKIKIIHKIGTVLCIKNLNFSKKFFHKNSLSQKIHRL